MSSLNLPLSHLRRNSTSSPSTPSHMVHQTPPLFSEILLEHSSSMSCTSLAQFICCLTIVRYCEYCITGGLPCGVGSFPSSLGMFTINGRNLAMSAVCWLFSRAKRCNERLSLVFLFIHMLYPVNHNIKTNHQGEQLCSNVNQIQIMV